MRVLDLVLVVKDEQGRVGVRELEQPEPDMVVIFDPSKAEGLGMIKLADIEMIAEQLEPNSSAAAAGLDLTTQLQQLAQLHNAGVLSDEEFAAAKAKLLGG